MKDIRDPFPKYIYCSRCGSFCNTYTLFNCEDYTAIIRCPCCKDYLHISSCVWCLHNGIVDVSELCNNCEYRYICYTTNFKSDWDYHILKYVNWDNLPSQIKCKSLLSINLTDRV